MRFRMIATLCAVAVFSSLGHAAAPTSITVQGKLTDASGVPLSAGLKQFTFRIFSAPVGGTEIWPGGSGDSQFIVSDAAGLWTAAVGTSQPLTDIVFSDTLRWLEITVTDGVIVPVTLPRVRLVTGPYAFRVATIDGASGEAISGKVSIGPGTTSTGVSAFAAGVNNTASGNWSSVSGGSGNLADDTGGVVAGGGNNRARGRYATVGGGGGSTPGDSNLASGDQSTVGGGRDNTAGGGAGATVAGGIGNLAIGARAAIAGGETNQATGVAAFVGGGMLNRARGAYSVVSGGGNLIDTDSNSAVGNWSTIAGGKGNVATGILSVIGGGEFNVASGQWEAVGGGRLNESTGEGATVGGGRNNEARGIYSTVGGGGSVSADLGNFATGAYSAIPGGHANQASGKYSMAAGRRADASDHGCFVWADLTDADFTSTSINQFLIRANGGVGIGTTSPEGPLHIQDGSAGAVTANANSIAVFESSVSGGWLSILGTDNAERGLLFSEPSLPVAGAIVFDQGGGGNDIGFRTGGNVTNMAAHASGNLTVIGCVDGNNTACASDRRFKKNISTVTDALDLIGNLRGVRYEWRVDEFPDRHFEPGTQYGVIAQEVREVLPEVIREREDGYLSVEYTSLIPLLLEAINEQQKRIEALEMKLDQQTP